MPFLDNAVPAGLAHQTDVPPEIDVPVPPFSKLFEAAFERENPFGSASVAATQPALAPFDPSFDPFQNIQGYEDYVSAFRDANSPDDVANVKARIDAERHRNELLASGGASGLLAVVGAGLADPLLLLPVGGQLVAVSRMGRALEAAARTAGAFGGAQAVTELGLQATQLTRPFSESVINVAGATVLGGVLGGAVGALGRPVTESLAQNVFKAGEVVERELTPELAGSVGAATRRPTTIDEETIANALGVDRALARTSPTLRLAQSESLEVRQLARELADQPAITRGEQQGFEAPISIEREINVAQARLAEALTVVDDAFVQYRMGRARQLGDVTRIAASDLIRGRQGLTYDEFKEAVTIAARRGDTHEIKEVAEAAGAVRQALFDFHKERAIRIGYFPPDIDVTTAPSYVTRVYNTAKIAAQRPQFEKVLTDWLVKSKFGAADTVKRMERIVVSGEARREVINTELAAKRAELKAGAFGRRASELMGEIKQLERELALNTLENGRLTRSIESRRVTAGMEDAEFTDIARQITDQLLGSAPNRAIHSPIPLARGPLRERTLDIEDELIEPWLENDIGRVARAYHRTMASDLALMERFGRTDMEEQFNKVREQYAALREGVTGERRLKQLDNKLNEDLRDLAAVRDRVRGVYGLPENPDGLWNRAFHVIRDLNYLRLLGGMTVSAFPDVGRSVMVHGYSRVIGDGVVPLLRDMEHFKLSAGEAKLAGNALDMILDTRAMSIADMIDDYGRWSKYERGLQGLSNKFGLVTLMAPWNMAMKQFVGVVGQTRTLRAIEGLAAGRSVNASERTRLAHLGISDEQVERIGAMFAKHGEKTEGGVWWANTNAWEDIRAVDAYRAALSKELDEVIVTPGQERPLWMTSTPLGRLIGQFRSFSFGATQRVMLTGLQRRDMATLNGILLMTSLGMLSYGVKRGLSTSDRPLPDHTTASGMAQWVREGIDQAGLVGWLFDANNIVEKLTGGVVGVSALTGAPPMSKYAARSTIEALLGPTVGFASDAANAIRALHSGEFGEADARAVRRMVPFQNLFYVRWLFDQAEEGLAGQ